MAITIVQLGSVRKRGEGLRIGTVRHLPRGVPKAKYAEQNWFDVWLPNLAPSADLVKQGRSAEDESAWRRFVQGYRREMKRPEAAHLLETLAALSHHTNFSIGCYCEDESHCHRSILRELLADAGAEVL